jgi:hypothetical protein
MIDTTVASEGRKYANNVHTILSDCAICDGMWVCIDIIIISEICLCLHLVLSGTDMKRFAADVMKKIRPAKTTPLLTGMLIYDVKVVRVLGYGRIWLDL